MSTSTTKVISLPMSQVNGSRYNPVSRVADVTKLQKSMEVNGQLHPITVVEFPDGVFRIADGHRRYEAAGNLGLEKINAIVHTPNKSEDADFVLDNLFVELNKGSRAFNGRDRLNVALQDGPIFDGQSQSIKTQLEALFTTEEERQMLVNKQITSTVLAIAKKSTKYVIPDVGQDTPTFLRRMKNHIMYILRNKVQQPLTAYMRLQFDREALKKAIDNNRPPPRVSSDRLKETWVK